MSPAEALAPHLGAIASRAEHLDALAAFPAADVALLRTIGLLRAPLPGALGGDGAGTEPGGWRALFDLLRLLGRANPSVGRLFEAHVNAVRLVVRHGGPEQATALAALIGSGAMLGLWVTDAHAHPLRREAGQLQGAKGPCSGAGHLRHALVTVTEGGSVRMALLSLTGAETVQPLGDRLHGMRASANGTIRLDGTPLPPTSLIGADGDYLREPDFSTGAWRTMAVTLGALDALVDAVGAQLCAKGHDQAPLQQARYGNMLIAQETARLFTQQAAECAETGRDPIPNQVACVNLARVAVETACLDAMRHAQRAIGLAALVRPNPIERLLRDLATYLRQPAPDAVLTEAALHDLARFA